jgi:hypothetical protein
MTSTLAVTVLGSLVAGLYHPIVEVELGARVSEMRGMTWPKTAGVLNEINWSEVAHTVRLRINGKPLTFYSRTLVLGQRDGAVREVIIMPMSRASSLEEALKFAESRMRRLLPEARVNETLGKWQKKRREYPIADEFNARFASFEKGCDLRVSVKQLPVSKTWYVALEFTVPKLYGLD